MLCTQQWLQESLNSAIQRSPQWRTQLELKKVKREVKHTENPRNILKAAIPEMSLISSTASWAGELRHPNFFYWNASHQDHQHSTLQPGPRSGFVAPKNSSGWEIPKGLWQIPEGLWQIPVALWQIPAEERWGLRHRAPDPSQLLGHIH